MDTNKYKIRNILMKNVGIAGEMIVTCWWFMPKCHKTCVTSIYSQLFSFNFSCHEGRKNKIFRSFIRSTKLNFILKCSHGKSRTKKVDEKYSSLNWHRSLTVSYLHLFQEEKSLDRTPICSIQSRHFYEDDVLKHKSKWVPKVQEAIVDLQPSCF